MSISANHRALQLQSTMAKCRYGFSNTADFLSPRLHYYCFSSIDDYMAMEILMIDQACNRCSSVMSEIIKDKSVYKGKIKQYIQLLYGKTHVGKPIPLCTHIENSIMRNMTDDEIDAFSVMASHIDSVLDKDLFIFGNSVLIEVGRSCTVNQTLVSKALTLQIFLEIVISIFDRCNTLQNGCSYLLCKNPLDAECRSHSYKLCKDDIKKMSDINKLIIATLCKGNKFSVPMTTSMEAGVNVIITKCTSIINIYNACKAAGIDIRRSSFNDIETIVKKLEEKKRKQESMDLSTPRKKKKTITKEEMEETFANKGWLVKNSNNK